MSRSSIVQKFSCLKFRCTKVQKYKSSIVYSSVIISWDDQLSSKNSQTNLIFLGTLYQDVLCKSAWRRKILTLFPNHWLQACRKNICSNLIMAHSISTRLQSKYIREKKLPICGHIHKILHGHVNSKPLVRIQPWKTISKQTKGLSRPKHHSGLHKNDKK